MAKNVIVSEETIKNLLEAHASLSAWYYELWRALQSVSGTASAPDDAARAAHVERLSADFPEVAEVARKIKVPRLFVPPPIVKAPEGVGGHEEPATLIEPAPARIRASQSALDAVPPPALVKPGDVK